MSKFIKNFRRALKPQEVPYWVDVKHGKILISPYNPELLTEIKELVPGEHRYWDPENNGFFINDMHVYDVEILIKKYYPLYQEL